MLRLWHWKKYRIHKCAFCDLWVMARAECSWSFSNINDIVTTGSAHLFISCEKMVMITTFKGANMKRKRYNNPIDFLCESYISQSQKYGMFN